MGDSSKYEIIAHSRSVNEVVDFYKEKNFWGERSHAKDLDVPRLLIVVTAKDWDEKSGNIPVEIKKELFYRTLVPLVLYANELIQQERDLILAIADKQKKGKALSSEDTSWLQSMAKKYSLQESDDLNTLTDQLLKRVDIIPPSLALGQSAYESGYGTSRFAMTGNALFGQWTYGGDGMKPEEQRKSKGDYEVAAYTWPFDSVRSYMHNLNTHNAYQELRQRRVEMRKQGKEVTGLSLADTLGSYSEKGEEYIKTLKSIITVNGLAIADTAYLRDEPMTLLVGVEHEREVGGTETKIEQLRASGELDRIIKSMRLEGLE